MRIHFFNFKEKRYGGPQMHGAPLVAMQPALAVRRQIPDHRSEMKAVLTSHDNSVGKPDRLPLGFPH